MASRTFLSRTREYLRRFGNASDLAALRSSMFKVVLVVSGPTALNVAFGCARASFDPSASPALRVMLVSWAGLHIPIYFLERRRPDLAYFMYVCLVFSVFAIIFDNVVYSPIERIGYQFAYHGALVFIALLLLPLAKFVLFSSVTTGLQMAMAYAVLHGEPADVLLGASLPLFVHWFPSLLAATLLDRHYRQIIQTQGELCRHKESLEEEVTARSQTIKEQQLELLHAEKMKAIGVLAGGVAHDFNNMLTGILGHVSVLKLRARPGDESFEAIVAVEAAALRAAELTKQLLGFARKGKLRSAVVDMHSVIKDTTSVISRTCDRGISIAHQLEADKPMVLGDPSQLHQVVMNLAVNARDAMPQGGVLTVSTGIMDLDQAFCRVHGDLTPDEYFFVAVADTGEGIPEEIRDRIFDPFFTTKRPGEGTGMGLAMVYGIVRNHGGGVEVRSEAGNGATVTVYLPLAEGASRPESTTQAFELPHGTGNILVVDDEETVASGTKAMLSLLGYDVAVAGNGRDAVNFYEKHRDNVDLVILDLTMPVMNGVECFDALKETNPDVKLVITTGHAFNDTVQKLLQKGVVGFLPKPYTMLELSCVMAKALSASDATGLLSAQTSPWAGTEGLAEHASVDEREGTVAEEATGRRQSEQPKTMDAEFEIPARADSGTGVQRRSAEEERGVARPDRRTWHQIKNQLAAISAHSSLLEHDTSLSDGARRSVRIVKDSGRQAISLMRRLDSSDGNVDEGDDIGGVPSFSGDTAAEPTVLETPEED